MSLDESKARAALAVLRAAGSVGADARVVGLHQLEGGWSRHSYVLDVADGAGAPRPFVVRVRPHGTSLDTDLVQEHDTYALLAEEPLPTPRTYAVQPSGDTPFGGPFFVMERVRGHSPNVWRRRDRSRLEEDWAQGGRLAEELVSHLATIHAVPVERAVQVLPVRSFHEEVEHWREIHARSALCRDPVVEEAYAWLLERELAEGEPRLVHADYRIGNCMIEGGRITGILDWELSYVGDPHFDLGYISLEYHAGKFARPGSLLLNAIADREWFFERYAELTGTEVDAEKVRAYAVLGALMLIAIFYTGMAAYGAGETRDIRMVWSRFAIPGLRQDMARLMGW